MGDGCRELAVTVRWGDYAPVEMEHADGSKTPVWRRTPHEEPLPIPLGGGEAPIVRDVPGSGGLQLHVAERPIDTMGLSAAELPAGAAAERALGPLVAQYREWIGGARLA